MTDDLTTRAQALGIATLIVPQALLIGLAASGPGLTWGALASLTAGAALLAGLLATLAAIKRKRAAVEAALEGVRRRDFKADTGWDSFDAVVADLGEAWGERRREASLLRSVLDQAPLAVVLCDMEGVVVLANRTARDLFTQGEALVGAPFSKALEGCPPEMRRAVTDQGNVLFTVDAGDGSDEQAYHVSRPRFDLDLQRHTLYLVTRLTRELNRQEVAIWKKVIRVINHEFNNSLAPISSLITSARKIVKMPPEKHDRLDKVFDIIEERTRHLQAFLQSYARFARLGPPDKRQAPWRSTLEQVRDLTGCRLEGEALDREGRFDPAQLQQALINVVKNATDAGSPPAETLLAVRPEPTGGVRVSVLDRGEGMTDEVMRQALVPFYSTKKAGTGLGLALVREIVDGHGGRLELAHREGGGVAVHMLLPDG